FRNVELRHDLETRYKRVSDLERRMHHVVQNAVYTKTNAEIFFVRLDVDVRCTTAKRVDHKNVDETNDRCVFARSSQGSEIDLILLFDDLKVFAFMAGKFE